ncbi:type 2 periplasmic-binding domain-containing protein [Klebsiella michiganensis]|uniref:hypothetical protein n=1 Tax=Klebsiella michiganensis TaxID=1134687 RepID=UPI0014839939|nr:hypothetical protein [Klebsiella michiganensis]
MLVVVEFLLRLGALRVFCFFSSGAGDLLCEGFDVAVRLGPLAASRCGASVMSRFSIVPVGAPSWFA